MSRDVKLGMFAGLVIVVIAVIAMSVWPGSTVEERLRKDDSRAVPGQIETMRLAPPEDPPPPTPRAQNPQNPPAETVAPREVIREAAQQVREQSIQPSSPPPSTRIHVVAADENLSTIAQLYYGDATKWPRIARANEDTLPDVHRLRPGMRLNIPPPQEN